MTPSVPHAPILWNRVLPKPTALLGEYAEEPPDHQRSTSLLQHHIASANFAYDVLASGSRRSTVPSISYSARPPPPTPTPPDHPHPHPHPPWTDSTNLPSDESTGTRLGPLSRKRTASLMASNPPSRETSPSSSSYPIHIPIEPASQFCLCQPEPKIPRPRNAFILYRQHHQAAVVAHHPGLANPEISKIIGEQWRVLPTKNKNEWKALAEEEKARHQQQYPDYRYQPRRYGRNGATTSSSSLSGPSTDAARNCLRCGGKVMNPPATPNTPFTPSHTTMPPHMAHMAGPRRQYTSQSGQPVSRPAIVSPPSTRVRPYGEVYSGGAPRPRELEYRARYGPGVVPPPPPPMSPDPKRRRFNGNGVYIPGRGETGPESPYTYSPRRTSLPRPDVVHPGAQHPRAMAPPPRSVYAHHANSQHQAMARNDPSLTLPPLQTQGQRNSASRVGSQGQKGGVEAMIISIPILAKIKTLSRVAPVLAAPGPASPPFDIRGQIIAVEGADDENVRGLTAYLCSELGKSGDFDVKVFEGPQYEENEGQEALVGLLTTISQWHQVSKDIVQFITTRPVHGSEDETSTPIGAEQNSVVDHEDASMAVADTQSVSDSAISPKTIICHTQDLSIQSPVAKMAVSTTSPSKQRVANPIAIIPQYQLTTVDAASTTVPIQDSYSPTDHWQWIAALWRGCVGPDVTIIVSGNEGPDESSNMVGPSVEVRLQDKAVIVRKGKGETAVAESSLRRVGFEVEEFLRADSHVR